MSEVGLVRGRRSLVHPGSGSWLLLVWALLACGAPQPLDDRTSLLLVTIDTLRADHVGAYGAEFAATPTLDQLAAEGTRFDAAIAATPLTLPSHATLLTGQRPTTHGVRHNGIHQLGDGVETLAERLTEEGFATGAVVAAAVLEARYGLAQGFGHYDDARGRAAGAGTFLERPADEVTDAALEWLAERETRQPFFLWVHYYDPHADYRPPEPHASAHAGRPYDGEIAFVDAQLARLLAAIDRERTLLAVTADHGESLGEHGEPTHSHTLYDATQRVPLLLAGPGVPAARVVRDVAPAADVAPTLLALLGAGPLAGADGSAWTPGSPSAETPETDPAGARGAYAETLATRYEHGWAPLQALRTATHHYVRAPRAELYDVGADPGQVHDLLAADAPGARDLAARLDARLPSLDAAGAGALDAETRAELQALGYALPETTPEATGIDPKDGLPALAAYHAAVDLYAEGHFAQAVSRLEAARAALPASASLHSLLAHAHMRMGRPDRALPEVDRALALQPSAGLFAVRGDALRQLRRPDEAAAAYRAGAALDAAEPLVQVGLMWVEARGGDLARAGAHAERAMAGARGDAGTWVRIGLVWEAARSYERAMEAFTRATETDPSHRPAQLLLGLALLREGEPQAAAPHLDRAGDLVNLPRYAERIARLRGGRSS